MASSVGHFNDVITPWPPAAQLCVFSVAAHHIGTRPASRTSRPLSKLLSVLHPRTSELTVASSLARSRRVRPCSTSTVTSTQEVPCHRRP